MRTNWLSALDSAPMIDKSLALTVIKQQDGAYKIKPDQPVMALLIGENNIDTLKLYNVAIVTD